MLLNNLLIVGNLHKDFIFPVFYKLVDGRNRILDQEQVFPIDAE